jgi:hypothetical protein
MKKNLFTLTLAVALALGGQSAFAEAKKTKDATAPADAPPAAAPAETPKAADTAKPKSDKPIPMYIRADEIDAAAKTITQNNKSGKKSKNVLSAAAEIKNGDKEAKLEDIKAGDWVSGSRKKTGDDTYEILKITKFGPKAEKIAGEPKKKK